MSKEQDFSVLFLDRQLCFPLYAASRLITKIFEPFLSALDITYPQYLVLLVLWQEDGKTVNNIGGRLYLESNTLTPLLKRLEQKGLLTRQRSTEDERKVLVTLTKAGKALRLKAVSIPQQLMAHYANGTLEVAEMQQFQLTLRKLMGVLAEAENT